MIFDRSLRRILTIAAACSAMVWLTATSSAAERSDKPNIVFILADDLGINDLSCYGRKDQPTPRLDKLAAEGMRFTTAYAACSVCSPTRAALLTGKAPARLHLTTFLPGRGDCSSQPLLHPKIQQRLPAGEATLASRLKAAGYHSACMGKWHLGGNNSQPTDFGFDEYYAGNANTTPNADEGGKGEYDLTRRANQFIERHRDEPFFLYLAHNNPHVPLAASPKLTDKHRDAFNPIYAATIETLDTSVGLILEQLQKLKLDDNTIVVFTSDNGGLHVLELPHTPATFNWPYRAGKGFSYEGGLLVPLMVRWPGKIKAGSTSDVPTITTDWLATSLELTGVGNDPKTPLPEDGVSFAKLLTGGAAPADRPLYWHIPHYTNQGGRPSGMIREGDWKLIEQYEDGRCELYDLKSDAGEAKDLGAQEPARVAQLRGKLEQWRRDMGAQSNTANPDFNPQSYAPLYRDYDASLLTVDPAKSITAAKLAVQDAAWRKGMDAALQAAKKTDAAARGPGMLILHAADAKPQGDKIRYEPQSQKDTIGFWVNQSDSVQWDFDAPHAGRFDVELLQGCGKGSGGAEVAVTVGEQTLKHKVVETGHFQRFVPITIGAITLDKPGKYTLVVKALTKPGNAVMDLRRVTLRAALPEAK